MTQTFDEVQRSVAPTIGLCTDHPLYFRCNELTSYDHHRRQWSVRQGGNLWFNTYFNGLSILRWRGTAALDDLHVEIAFRGRLTARLHRMQVGPIATIVDEVVIASPTPTVHRWAVPAWTSFDDGVLFLSLEAHVDSVVDGFSYVTTTAPLRPVRLGLCITHYDRRSQIVPAIARLKRELLDDPKLAHKVALVVVDNSRNLDAADTTGATVIANRNLGGAGGFARGMMHLNDDGSFTHALFMDDDASCEVEGIRRTIALLGHARKDHTAISGAMLRAAEPYRQFERGARFTGLCRPERSGIDLRDPAVLAWNEREQSSDYGGWWFFAFPLRSAIGSPYPYFVRGDDVDFSLRNRFDIVHANGIASWQEDFAIKHGPQTSYLDARSHLLHIFNGFGGGRGRASMVSLRLFLLANLAGLYEQAAAVVMAVEDVGRGPEFFREHADLAEPRRRLQAIIRRERMRPMEPATLRDAVFTGLPESRLRGFVRRLSANGHLIPQLFFHRRAVRFEKSFGLPLRGTFRRRKILVHDEFSGNGMEIDHSKRLFFGNLLGYARAMTSLLLRFPRLAADYRAAYPGLASDAFWRGQFGLSPVARKTDAAPAAPDAADADADADIASPPAYARAA